MLRILLLALVLVLTGCATQNIAGTASYTLVPDSQIVTRLIEPLAHEPYATIIVKRDAGMFGSGLSSTLILDTKHVAKIDRGQYLEFRVTPGEHIFGVALSTLFNSTATKYEHEIAIDCKAGQIYYVRLYPQAGNGMAIGRSSQ